MRSWFFLRGLVRESGHWAGFLERFSVAFPQDKIVPLDLPGTGLRFRERSPWSIPGYVDVLREEFLRHQTGENHFFSVSLGAMVGLEWMRRHPRDFGRALLINTSMSGLSSLHHRLKPGTLWPILRMFFSPSKLERERLILQITSNRPEIFPATAAAWARIAEERPVARMNAVRQLVAAARFRPPLERPETKILLLNSAGDQLCDFSCSQKISAHWQLPLETHATAGHDLTLDDPGWVLDRARAFTQS